MKIKDLFIVKEEEKKETTDNLDDTIFKKPKPKHLKGTHKLTSNDTTWGIIAHLSCFIGYFLPLGNILGPFVIYSLKKETNSFAKENARAAINFQLSFTLYTMIAFFFYLFIAIYLVNANPFLMYGFFLGPIVLYYLLQLYWISKAIQSSSEGKIHQYPFSINFIKNY